MAISAFRRLYMPKSEAFNLAVYNPEPLGVVIHNLILIYQGVHCCTKVCNLHGSDTTWELRMMRLMTPNNVLTETRCHYGQ